MRVDHVRVRVDHMWVRVGHVRVRVGHVRVDHMRVRVDHVTQRLTDEVFPHFVQCWLHGLTGDTPPCCQGLEEGQHSTAPLLLG